MSKENQSDKPAKKAAKKEAAATVAAAQATNPLQVEVRFNPIFDFKQAIGFDGDGKLVMTIQFKTVLNQFDVYEVFRLVNLLKQPHGSLFATVGSPQSAMDFKFSQEGKVEILKAEIAATKALPAGKKGKPADQPADQGTGEKPVDPTEGEITFKDITFNHVPEEKLPYGCVIDFTNGATDKSHVVAGRGKTTAEAVISGVKQTKAKLFDGLNQPFEIVAAVKKTPETDAQIKIIRAIEVGTSDLGDGKGGANPKKGA
jgi:hypothetical protein